MAKSGFNSKAMSLQLSSAQSPAQDSAQSKVQQFKEQAIASLKASAHQRANSNLAINAVGAAINSTAIVFAGTLLGGVPGMLVASAIVGAQSAIVERSAYRAGQEAK